MPQQRDIRDTELYKEVENFYGALHAPGTDSITDAAEVSVSADGTRLAFTGTVYSDLVRSPQTRVCLLEIGTGDLSIVPSSNGSDRTPRFSPQNRLAFLSDRTEKGNFQLYLADHAMQNVEAAPPVDGVIESMSWSNDGASLLLGVAGFGADMAGCQGGATTLRKTSDAPEWLPVIDTGDAENLWRSAYVYSLKSRQMRRVSPAGLNIWECAWLGDDELMAVASSSHSEGTWYTSRVMTLNLHTAAVRELYRPKDQIGCAIAAKSGRHIVLVDTVCSDRLVVCGPVYLIEAQTGAARALDTQRVDVSHLAWRGEDTVVFAGHRGFETVIGEVTISNGGYSEIWSSVDRTFGTWYPSFDLLPQGGIAAVGESYAVPPEIVCIDKAGYHVVRSLGTKISINASFNSSSVEPFVWKARDGLEIQGWLVRPPGTGPWPLVMDIHGGPVWNCRNRWQGRLRGAKVLADHGVASLYPNPRGSSGRGEEFARRVKGDMGGEDTHDYLTAFDALVAQRIADPKRLGVTGISYGGFMSAWLITQDTRFAAAVPISAVSNWYSQHRTSQIPHFDKLFLDNAPASPNGLFFSRSPVMFADRVRTPTLQLTGALDQNTPPTQALEFHRSLLEHGVRSELATYPTAGHGIRTFPPVIDATARYVGWFLEHFVQSTPIPS
jgi:dipeptidyl aminopeptidase/acylaminoacyl peptidase